MDTGYFLIAVAALCGMTVFLGSFAFRPRRNVYSCARCQETFLEDARHPFPKRCGNCGATDWFV